MKKLFTIIGYVFTLSLLLLTFGVGQVKADECIDGTYSCWNGSCYNDPSECPAQIFCLNGDPAPDNIYGNCPIYICPDGANHTYDPYLTDCPCVNFCSNGGTVSCEHSNEPNNGCPDMFCWNGDATTDLNLCPENPDDPNNPGDDGDNGGDNGSGDGGGDNGGGDDGGSDGGNDDGGDNGGDDGDPGDNGGDNGGGDNGGGDSGGDNGGDDNHVTCQDGSQAPNYESCGGGDENGGGDDGDDEGGGADYQCPDGSWVSDSTMCPSITVYLCDNGTPVYDLNDCDVCIEGLQLCSDGGCYESCGDGGGCPDGQTLCNDHSCSYSCNNGCAQNETLCSDSVCRENCGPCGQNEIQCSTDPSICAIYESQCPVCESGETLCANNTCAVNCDAGCPDGQTLCGDGICGVSCTTTIICSDGSAVTDPAQCGACGNGETRCTDGSCAVSCPTTVTCPDGSTVADVSQCGPCGVGEVACADGSCAEEDHCPVTYVCPNGSVVTDPVSCGSSCQAGEFCCAANTSCMAVGQEGMCECGEGMQMCDGECKETCGHDGVCGVEPDTEIETGDVINGHFSSQCALGEASVVSIVGEEYQWVCSGDEGYADVDCTARVKICDVDEFYCENVGCIPTTEACQPPPDLVLHDKLKVQQYIEPDEECLVEWGPEHHVLSNFDAGTRCVLSNQRSSLLEFTPTEEGPFSYVSGHILEDQIYRLTCHEVDEDGHVLQIPAEQTATGSCRLNLRGKEYN